MFYVAGSISKIDLKSMLKWGAKKYGYSALDDIVKATPTAELRPTEPGAEDDEHSQVRAHTECPMLQGLCYHHRTKFGCRSVNQCMTGLAVCEHCKFCRKMSGCEGACVCAVAYREASQ